MIVMTELMKRVVMKKENVKMKLEVPEEVVNIVAIICPEVATCAFAIPVMLLIQKTPKNVLMSMNARHLDTIVHKFALI
jgi:cellobiose-specific phosphotransferase system component IIC